MNQPACPCAELYYVDLLRARDASLVTAVTGLPESERPLRSHHHAVRRERVRRECQICRSRMPRRIIAEALEYGDLDTAELHLRSMQRSDGSRAFVSSKPMCARKTREVRSEAALAKTAGQGDPEGQHIQPAVDLVTRLMRVATRVSGSFSLAVRFRSRRWGHLNDAPIAGHLEESAGTHSTLASGDPAWDVHAALKADDDAERDSEREDNSEHEKVVAEATALRGSLRAASSRLGDLERQLASKQAELDVARSPVVRSQAVTVASDQVERERMRNLRTKVEALRGHDPRRQRGTRGPATAARCSRLPARAQATPPTVLQVIDNADSVACESIADIAREIAFADARTPSARCPRRRARRCCRRGRCGRSARLELATRVRGVALSWAKDMPQQAMMARIGIHHRLLFRIEPRSLEALDLVTRENLLATLEAHALCSDLVSYSAFGHRSELDAELFVDSRRFEVSLVLSADALIIGSCCPSWSRSPKTR